MSPSSHGKFRAALCGFAGLALLVLGSVALLVGIPAFVGAQLGGGGLSGTSTDASRLTSGTLPDARLSANVPLLLMNRTVIGAPLAELKTFTLTLPTQYENGDALAPAAITRTSIKCGAVDGGPYTERAFAPQGATSIQADFGAGGFYCVATVTAAGSESGPSNQVFFTVTLRPRAPGLSVD